MGVYLRSQQSLSAKLAVGCHRWCWSSYWVQRRVLLVDAPVFAFTTTERVTGWDVFALSRALRERGWQVPAYTFPADRQDLSVLRIVCRNGFSHDLADLLLADLHAVVDQLNNDSRLGTATGPSGFRH